ncbi:MAG: CDP-alcohol phosphatidyltransferase family protein [Bryobacteraceae bacterium]|jgi:cardiolipin synthase
MRTWLTLPNLFTLARLLLAPVIVSAIVHRRALAALSLFAVAAATDVIDGYLARHFGTATAAGAFLDPIADKLLLTGVYLALALAGSVPWWLVSVIFARDLFILASAAVALLATKLRAFPPSVWGKASTFLQILTAVAFLGRDAFGSPLLAASSAALIWPTLALTVWSGIHYGWRGARLLRMPGNSLPKGSETSS